MNLFLTPHHTKGGPEACYGADVWMGRRGCPHVLLPSAGDRNKYWNETQFPGTNCRCCWRSLAQMCRPRCAERGSKLPGFYLKPMARLLRLVESGAALDALSPCPGSVAPPLYFRRPINKAGCSKGLSTRKTHPLAHIFLGQGCDKGFKYRKPQRELDSKGTSGKSYMSNGLSVHQTRGGGDGTHPDSDAAQVLEMGQSRSQHPARRGVPRVTRLGQHPSLRF